MASSPVISTTRLLAYSHDGFGLGNLSRTLKICERLSQEIASLSILLLTGSPLMHAFRLPPKVDYIKLPCVHRRARNRYVSRFLRTPFKKLSQMREELIHSAFRGFQPHIVLVDKVPLGINDELQRSLDWLRSARPKSRVILGLRDVLDDPGHVQDLWQRRRFYEALERYFDSIWVFGSSKVCDMVHEYDFPPSIAGKLSYCGYIMDPPPRRGPEEVRRALGVPEDGKFVLVTAGGGGDGYELMKSYLKSVRTLAADGARPGAGAAGAGPGAGTAAAGPGSGSGVFSLLILGPDMPLHKKERLLQRATVTPGILQVLDFSTDMASYMSAADLVVSMGGYNTLCEILALEKRAIVVPRVRPVNEQWIRAHRLQALGLLDVIDPHELSAQVLGGRIRSALFDAPVASPTVSEVLDTQGLPRVSHFVARELRQVS